ncbi:MAG TPA: MBL fold metallo-hydrolase [Sedimenticola thiotaurini]|uniref:MBL fold metallo-hydrolase n=1 Tax=Sedimenticola thiotaurini TaxID=1543721 RepID=A0A831RNQ3_9GAMM|nr:MBL fold metallo-hydrolase [Sedimenticola thiotaurini]
MRFVSLGSGSRGNATLIEADGSRLLLDCGFAGREAERRLAGLGVDPSTLDAILVTHEHQDHIRGVGVLARRYRLPVYLTHGTLRAGRLGEVPELHLIHPQQPALRIGAFRVTPYPVPHDAREPVQFLFQAGRDRLGVLTDAGMVTPHMVGVLASCSALLLECNHDPGMLARGPYPPALQARVGGRLGHLNNGQAAALLQRIEHPGLEHLVAAHLSEKNNTPELARRALLEAVPAIEGRLTLASQEEGSGWVEL